MRSPSKPNRATWCSRWGRAASRRPGPCCLSCWGNASGSLSCQLEIETAPLHHEGFALGKPQLCLRIIYQMSRLEDPRDQIISAAEDLKHDHERPGSGRDPEDRPVNGAAEIKEKTL